MYTLDRWRRILALNKKKETKTDEQTKTGGKKKKGNSNIQLSSIVNKILQGKTGEECVVSDDAMSGDENENDNYDTYK